MPPKTKHLTTTRIGGRIPRTKKAAMDYLRKQARHGTDQTGAFIQPQTYAICVKLWSWSFKDEAEETLFRTAIGKDLVFWDWESLVSEFVEKHNCRVTFGGRSSGWLLLLEKDWSPFGIYVDDFKDATAKEVIQVARTVWDFNHLAEAIADDFLWYAANEGMDELELDSTDRSA